MPRAYGSQCGAPRPGERRHEVDAAGVGHARAPAPRSRRRCRMSPRPSRSHCTAAPAMKTLPSSAYSVRAAALPRDGGEQAVARRDRLRRRCSSAGSSRCRRCSSPCPGCEAGLAEERRLLVAGDAGDRDRAPNASGSRRAQDAATTARPAAAARAARRAARAARRPSRRVWMSKSSVREAFVASVTCTRAAASASRRASVSMVPKASSPRFARAPARRATWSSSHSSLVPGEVGVEHQAGLRREQSAHGPAALQARRTSAAVRRSCQTIALRDRPAGGALPQHRRLALVGDADRGDVARAPSPRAGERLAQHARDCVAQISSGRARPSRAAGRSGGTPAARRRRPCPRRSKTIARELVVPWSSARTNGIEASLRNAGCGDLGRRPKICVCGDCSRAVALDERDAGFPTRLAARLLERLMPLSLPVPRERLHARTVSFEGYTRADGLFDIEARLTDVKDARLHAARPACVAPATRCTTCGCGSRSTARFASTRSR